MKLDSNLREMNGTFYVLIPKLIAEHLKFKKDQACVVEVTDDGRCIVEVVNDAGV